MKNILLWIFLFASMIVHAQDAEFIVYFTKGKVLKTVNGSKALQKGDRLGRADVLQVPDKAEVVLICKSYNTVRIKAKGRYTVQSLLSQCNQAKTSFSSSYFHYIWDELTHVHGSPEKDPLKYMHNTGAVSRGCAMVQTSLPVDTVHYVSGQLPIYFKTAHRRPHVSVYNDIQEGALLVKETLGNDPIQMDWLMTKLKGEGEYYWQITDADGTSCERNYLRVWNGREYQAAVAQLLASVITTEPAETAYMKGYLLEEKHFLAEAFKYYQQAAKLNSNNTIYKKTLLRFYE
ncbi:hypothetical protein [Flavisolibacter tropicus]|uniref:YkuD domain-containing protein n=1 Tax=Flavisolibacter tropicus TaxID=1492898 RepID=A0A172U1A5_9BACT|nr:hypothetical protein [Flavisolibacter tropicus]ANE53036.1 hypothetical protein SY85_23735 [Flavisolibacter tropicus]